MLNVAFSMKYSSHLLKKRNLLLKKLMFEFRAFLIIITIPVIENHRVYFSGGNVWLK